MQIIIVFFLRKWKALSAEDNILINGWIFFSFINVIVVKDENSIIIIIVSMYPLQQLNIWCFTII